MAGQFGGYASYADAIKAITDDTTSGLSDETKKELKKSLAEQQYGPQADLTQFDSLLSKLEQSKMRQQRQKSVENRRDVFSQGLAQMMSNF
jgi:hypothetical protein